jgi:hypothetical protein
MGRGNPLPWNMVVMDEVACMKDSESVRMKKTSWRESVDSFGDSVKVVKHGWRNIIDMFSFRVGLTATPSSNGYMDLFGQYLCIDGGERLGKFVTHYRDAYFIQDASGWGYKLQSDGQARIEVKIKDMTLSMNNPQDYLDLPSVVYKNMYVELPPRAREIYTDVETEMFAELDSGLEVEIFHELSLTLKLSQIATGSVYVGEVDNRQVEEVHDEKLKALEEVLIESGGNPIMVSYQFRSDADRIMKRFKKYKPINFSGTAAKDTSKVIDKVVNGQCKLIIMHSMSAGHGVDGLQKAVRVLVWYGMGNNLGLYLQTNGRIDRQGQEQVVSIIHILARKTVDEALLSAIERKDTSQNALKQALQDMKKRA